MRHILTSTKEEKEPYKTPHDAMKESLLARINPFLSVTSTPLMFTCDALESVLLERDKRNEIERWESPCRWWSLGHFLQKCVDCFSHVIVLLHLQVNECERVVSFVSSECMLVCIVYVIVFLSNNVSKNIQKIDQSNRTSGIIGGKDRGVQISTYIRRKNSE